MALPAERSTSPRSWKGGNQETVTCSYTSVGTFTATVTVQNACGLITQDSLVVTINA